MTSRELARISLSVNPLLTLHPWISDLNPDLLKPGRSSVSISSSPTAGPRHPLYTRELVFATNGDFNKPSCMNELFIFYRNVSFVDELLNFFLFKNVLLKSFKYYLSRCHLITLGFVSVFRSRIKDYQSMQPSLCARAALYNVRVGRLYRVYSQCRTYTNTNRF